MKIKSDAIAHHFVGKKTFQENILQAKRIKTTPEITQQKLDKVTIGSYPRFDVRTNSVNLILTVQGFLEDDVLDATISQERFNHIYTALKKIRKPLKTRISLV